MDNDFFNWDSQRTILFHLQVVFAKVDSVSSASVVGLLKKIQLSH